MRKINIAGGPIDVNGWVNVEYGVFPFLKKNFGFILGLCFKFLNSKELNYLKSLTFSNNIIFHNVTKNLDCFEDESIDFFYCSHFIEHLTKDECSKLLKNIEKKIKKQGEGKSEKKKGGGGGILRLVTPDLDLYINNSSTKDINSLFYSGYHHQLFSNLKPQNFIKNFFLKLICILFVRPHKYIYNKEEIISLIKSSLISSKHEIKFYNQKEGNCPNIDLLDIHDKSIYLEVIFSSNEI
jgi:hypothetical protein